MKSYEQMAQSVLARRDAILEEKRRKKAAFFRFTTALSSVGASAAICIGAFTAWHIIDSTKTDMEDFVREPAPTSHTTVVEPETETSSDNTADNNTATSPQTTTPATEQVIVTSVSVNDEGEEVIVTSVVEIPAENAPFPSEDGDSITPENNKGKAVFPPVFTKPSVTNVPQNSSTTIIAHAPVKPPAVTKSTARPTPGLPSRTTTAQHRPSDSDTPENELFDPTVTTPTNRSTTKNTTAPPIETEINRVTTAKQTPSPIITTVAETFPIEIAVTSYVQVTSVSYVERPVGSSKVDVVTTEPECDNIPVTTDTGHPNPYLLFDTISFNGAKYSSTYAAPEECDIDIKHTQYMGRIYLGGLESTEVQNQIYAKIYAVDEDMTEIVVYIEGTSEYVVYYRDE